MDMKEYFRELGRKGGNARMKSTTPEQRKKIAKMGAKALKEKIKKGLTA